MGVVFEHAIIVCYGNQAVRLPFPVGLHMGIDKHLKLGNTGPHSNFLTLHWGLLSPVEGYIRQSGLFSLQTEYKYIPLVNQRNQAKHI